MTQYLRFLNHLFPLLGEMLHRFPVPVPVSYRDIAITSCVFYTIGSAMGSFGMKPSVLTAQPSSLYSVLCTLYSEAWTPGLRVQCGCAWWCVPRVPAPECPECSPCRRSRKWRVQLAGTGCAARTGAAPLARCSPAPPSAARHPHSRIWMGPRERKEEAGW